MVILFKPLYISDIISEELKANNGLDLIFNIMNILDYIQSFKPLCYHVLMYHIKRLGYTLFPPPPPQPSPVVHVYHAV
jgi:hypothetical protein